MAAGYHKPLVLLPVLPLWLQGASPRRAAGGTVEGDEKACSDQLEKLASCIPFVSGGAQRPAPECCRETQAVRSNSPECLCVLIKESADPAMGLPINTTLALQMPAACNIDARVSDCPSILKLPPGSPDAKIFFTGAGAGAGHAAATANPSSSPASASSSSPSGSSPSTATATSRSSNAARRSGCPVSYSVVGLFVSVAWAVM